jgi:molybdopterin adenylyltransferase
MSYEAHHRHARHVSPRGRIGIITSSDSRDLATDESGALAERALSAHHEILGRVVVPDDVAKLRRAANAFLARGADVLLVNGGTGVGPRDVTLEAFQPWFDQELPGFGELFRSLSLRRIGTGAWLTRATAGTVRRRNRRALLVLLPGSPHAVRLGVRRLLLPELGHVLTLLHGVRPPA